MAIIVSKNNKDAKKLDPQDFSLETHMQEYIYDNPTVIPLYDVKADTRLFVAAREFATKSGPIDALGFDQDGNIYVVETKLYRNPDKRTVVAQVLDYGASLWRHSTNFDAFLELLNRHTTKQFSVPFQQKYAEFFEKDDVSDCLVAIKDNLNAGNIKFVVMMDNLHDQLKDLIVYVNQNSQFDIYAVELEYYKHAEFEIIIPKLFGDEVKKEVVSTKTASGYTYNPFTAREFDDHVMRRTNLSDDSKRTLLELRDIYQELANKIDSSVFYYYSPKADRAGYGVNDIDGKQALLVMSNGEVWFYQKDKTGTIAAFGKRVLNRLIDEQILDKTEKNLLASQWSVKNAYFTNPNSDPSMTGQLNRFIAICKEEIARL